jgi:6-phospho-beta-glucosidase
MFGAEWLRTLRMIPNEYLYYFYFGEEAVEGMRRSPRGEFLLAQQEAFYAGNGDALAAWRAARAERDASYMAEAGVEGGHADDEGGYEAEAMAVVEAIATGARAELIVNTANASALPFLDTDAVVEVPALVDRSGPRPLAVGDVPDHARALIETIKAVERATIEAALTGSSELAVEALALHPLVPSVTIAREIFAGYRARLPELQERFA